MEYQEKKQSIWDVITSKKAFWTGVVAGVLGAGLIALIITVIVLAVPNDGSAKSAKASDDTEVAADTDSEVEGSLNVDGFRNMTGAEDPDIYLVEFSDFECSYCGRHHPTMESVIETYDNVAWVWKHFPLSFHTNAVPAGIASECAGDQGSFWDFADELIDNQDSLSDDLYTEIAGDLGLDMDEFESCLADADIEARLDDEFTEGANVGVAGTPATYIVASDGTILDAIAGAVPEAQITEAIDLYL